MNNKPADTRSYATKQRSEPGKGDDIPCVRCGAPALDTGLECDECGFDNYESVTGKPFSATPEAKDMTDHANELRRHARKITHPAGDVPAVMLAAADEIERLQSVIAGLRADFETAHARMMTSAEREREACAKAIENSINVLHNNSEWADGYIQATKDIADGIRARGDA